MPILSRETDLFPADLLDRAQADGDRHWWALYSRSRQEKQLMRRLHAAGVPFYAPMVPKRNRSPAGRIRVSHVPLFSNYVFMFGGRDERLAALATNCVSRCLEPPESRQLVADLQQLRRLIAVGAPLTPETRLQPGEEVRVRNGVFAGFEGTVVRREKETRLLVAVRFLQQGVSVLLEDCQLEGLGKGI